MKAIVKMSKQVHSLSSVGAAAPCTECRTMPYWVLMQSLLVHTDFLVGAHLPVVLQLRQLGIARPRLMSLDSLDLWHKPR